MRWLDQQRTLALLGKDFNPIEVYNIIIIYIISNNNLIINNFITIKFIYFLYHYHYPLLTPLPSSLPSLPSLLPLL